jgi:hypothetical protein
MADRVPAGYAKFGKLKAEPEKAAGESDAEASTNDFRPSRRVRDVPGGQHTDIFAQGDEGDALSTAPPKEGGAQVRNCPSLAVIVIMFSVPS